MRQHQPGPHHELSWRNIWLPAVIPHHATNYSRYVLSPCGIEHSGLLSKLLLQVVSARPSDHQAYMVAHVADMGRFLAIRDVVSETSLSRATIYRMIAKGQFPAPVKVSAQRVAWIEGAVQRWKNQQVLALAN